MKVTVIDSIFPIGHKTLNAKLISLFPKNIDLLVVNNKKYYNFSNENSIKTIDVIFLNLNKSYILTVLFQILTHFEIWIKILFRKNDIRVFFTFESLSFAFVRFFHFGSKNILIHHDNTDNLSIGYINFFFKTYMNSVKHIVFADYIKDRLVQLGVNPKNIFILTHPISHTDCEKYINQQKISEDCQSLFIGLGYSSDESLFDKIIKYEEQTGFLIENNIKIILRSHSKRFESNNIKIICGHISQMEYEDLFSSSTGVLLLYPKTYYYRYSGMILDALRFNKRIIGVSIPVIENFRDKYPNMCSSFDDIEELFNLMLLAKKNSIENCDYQNFINNHSDLRIQKEIEFIFHNYE